MSGLKHLWLDAGYEGRGKRWAEEFLGVSVELVRKPSKPIPEKVAKVWAQEWAKVRREDRLAEAHAAERLSSVAQEVGGRANLLLALSEQEDELRDYERLCASAEAFVYAAMIRLMARRLARA